MHRGLVLNIQRYCLHDGPGIRTTVFLKGCPLSCQWCHNPESQPAEPTIAISESRCIRCGLCLEACPRGGDKRGWDSFSKRSPAPFFVEAADCVHCGACVEACPTGARQWVGSSMPARQVVDEVLRDRPFHDQSSGGVTLSGGEPLMQPAFLIPLLRSLKDHDVHTAVDTCGFAPRQTVADVARHTDLFLYDLKCLDDGLHRRHTGVSNLSILDNLKALTALNANIWVRIPLIPGFNLDDTLLGELADFIASLQGIRQVNLLPYHRLGANKWQRDEGGVSVSEARSARTDPITPEQIDRALHWFRGAGLTTFVGG